MSILTKLFLALLIGLAISSCKQPAQTLPPVAPSNEAAVEEDEMPVDRTEAGTFRLFIPKVAPEMIEYSGTSN